MAETQKEGGEGECAREGRDVRPSRQIQHKDVIYSATHTVLSNLMPIYQDEEMKLKSLDISPFRGWGAELSVRNFQIVF